MPQTPTNVETAAQTADELLLEVKGLKVQFPLDEGVLRAVDGVSLTLRRGETLGLIGESGCGKSMLARALLQLIKAPGRIVGGELLYHEQGGPVDIARLKPTSAHMHALRGKHIAMVFQEPMTSLSPVHTIGDQIMEMVLVHRTKDRRQAEEIARQTLERVGMPDPRRTMQSYPHELSGGLRQRAMIAMALSASPELLIADEPTTALDVTVQWQILRLLEQLRDELGMAMIYITHDLGVVAQVADSMAVMYLGKIVECGPVTEVFDHPLHPYTQGLLRSMPLLGQPQDQLEAIAGNVPTPIDLPDECHFRPRCPHAFEACFRPPALSEVQPGHTVRCFLHHNVVAREEVTSD